MLYLEWNDAIARRFFNEEKSGREVLLFVNREIIDELGGPTGVNTDDFLEAIKQGPPWSTKDEICRNALQAYHEWRKRGLKYPPYIAYLAFFVLAASSEGPFAPHAYYPRFWKLLKEPEHSKQPPSFDMMIMLWDDLEKWSCEDQHEQLGRFTRRTRGNWWRVGLPLSQTLFSDEERKRLPVLFFQADLDPADSPSPEIVPRVLQYYGRGILERRTLRLLESDRQEDIILKKALSVLVLDELEEWDGRITEEQEGKGGSKPYVQGFLRVCIHMDNVAHAVKCYLRLRIGGTYPNEELNFNDRKSSRSWSCRELCQGWSTVLQDNRESPPVALDASRINWNEGIHLEDDECQLRAKLKGATARLFIPGKQEGLPDWIETRRLERSTEFLVACRGPDIDRVERWGAACCRGFERKDFSGFPPGWAIYYGRNASDSCDGIDVLTLSGTARLALRGGIRSGSGNTYLAFAPPRIVLENSLGDESITVNGVRIGSIPGTSVWELPDDSPANEILRIEAKGSDTDLQRIIRLENPSLPLSFRQVPCRDNKGMLCERSGKSSFACGAEVNAAREDPCRPFPRDLPTHLSRRIVFIGRKPGEISDWPRDPLPSTWTPAWAIARERRKEWRAHFCGQEEELVPAQLKSGYAPGNRDTRRWKEALWTRRRIIKVSGLNPVAQAWVKYLEAARDV
ncbi:MAG: hypothetical protein AB1512_02675 [Thermodesulfobacteriota bacterium]